jgi:hypothetical protein
MSHYSVHALLEDLSKFQDLLQEGTMLSFSADEREALLAESRRHLLRLENLGEGSLTIGLLGGTGVGKSSIMNALAGSEIASTSYRRPHTEQVLIYRHEAGLLPLEVRTMEAPWREITHRADAVRQILLCDLPDFDSLVGSHRLRVMAFLQHLDLLVWVTSPEKYADERFYNFLHEAPKARQNFYFIINKADLFFAGQSLESGYQELAKVTAGFQQYLTAHGVSHPLIYCVSAEQIKRREPAAPWNQFASLRQQVFQHRDAKEIMAIKAANLDLEVQLLLSILQRESRNLSLLSQFVDAFVQELKDDRSRWLAAGSQSIEVLLEGRGKQQIPFRVNDGSCLVGPGRFWAALISDWQKWIRRRDETAGAVQLIPEGVVGSPLQRELERIEDRLVHGVLTRGLPVAFQKQLTEVVSADRQWKDLKGQVNHCVETWLMGAPSPSFAGFRMVQYVVYFIIFVGLFLALGGESGWRGFFQEVSWAGFAGLVSAGTQNLFSPNGLAALGSFMIINLFFGLRFYARAKKLLQRYSQKFIDSLKLELGRIWQSELESIIDQLEDYARRLRAQMSAVQALQEKGHKD